MIPRQISRRDQRRNYTEAIRLDMLEDDMDELERTYAAGIDRLEKKFEAVKNAAWAVAATAATATVTGVVNLISKGGL